MYWLLAILFGYILSCVLCLAAVKLAIAKDYRKDKESTRKKELSVSERTFIDPGANFIPIFNLLLAGVAVIHVSGVIDILVTICEKIKLRVALLRTKFDTWYYKPYKIESEE